jgi:hypothetical protein
VLILCILDARALLFVVLGRISTFFLNDVATRILACVLCNFNVILLTFSLSPPHRSSVAKAGAPVSPQSSPPSPLALLRARALLLFPESVRAFALLVTLVAMGEASMLRVAICVKKNWQMQDTSI